MCGIDVVYLGIGFVQWIVMIEYWEGEFMFEDFSVLVLLCLFVICCYGCDFELKLCGVFVFNLVFVVVLEYQFGVVFDVCSFVVLVDVDGIFKLNVVIDQL